MSDCAEVGGGRDGGAVCGGASRGVAGNGGALGDVGWGRRGRGVGFAFAEDAVERGAGEPNEVAAGVHVECDGL